MHKIVLNAGDHSPASQEAPLPAMKAPELIRVGDKLLNRQKIDRSIDRILELRARGSSQQQVAARLGIDRTFISRLETLGEVRKGRSIALIGFPLDNTDELAELALAEGLEYVLLMSNDERWRFVSDQSGADLLTQVLDVLAEVRQHDVVILIGSRQRNQAAGALIDGEVFAIDLGSSPLTEDKHVDPAYLRDVIRKLRQADGQEG